jgi:hypothetical protein
VNFTNITDAVDCTSEATGPENVFHIVPKGDGMLTATIGHGEDPSQLYCDPDNPEIVCADFVMYLRQNACNSAAAGDQLSCDDYTENPNAPFGYDELLTVKANVTANQDYWLIVDGLDDMFGVGVYYLEVELQ